MTDIWDSIELAVAAYRDSTTKGLLQRFKDEYYLTLSAEADARRAKATAIIQNIAKLRIELKKFEYTYSLVVIKTGNIPAVEKMLKRLNNEIEELKKQKNRLS